MSETVVGEKGMVTAPHRAAAQVGAEVMRAGGNAVEAMVAMAAAIAVVYPHMNGIGGDGFFLIAEPGRTPRVIDACGAAGSLATIARYAKKGYDAIPARGADAALTVAGAVSGWGMALEAAAALGGRMPRRDLIGEAVRMARAGITVSRSQAAMTAQNLATLKDVPGFAAHFLVDGKPPEMGASLKLAKLADTLEQLAHAGTDDFYHGDIAAEIAADLEAVGAPVTRGDLVAHEARLRQPLSLALDGVTLFNTPPPTQGMASLIVLGLFERLGVKRGEGFDHVHGLVEATKRAFAVRDANVADPALGHDVKPFLAAGWLADQADRIDRKRAGPWSGGADKGDTIWMGAIDAAGVAVSYIQSIFWEFGSGVVLPRTGILWQNRGASFSLDPAATNPLAPGRKPFHTLNPAFARFADGRVMVYGSMGGDGQPQFQAQVFTRHVRFSMEVGEAIAAPRFRAGKTWGDTGTTELSMENRFDPDLVAALERAGHRVVVLDEAYSDGMGHAGAIVRRADGRLFGASDPRSDGAAAGG
jgi:gamma-glutamyltranspeptidase/glutathione hydrolase